MTSQRRKTRDAGNAEGELWGEGTAPKPGAARKEPSEHRHRPENPQMLAELRRSEPAGRIVRVIAGGASTRTEILHAMRLQHWHSYRHVGFLLTRLTGTNPDIHLWFKDTDRRYHLLSA